MMVIVSAVGGTRPILFRCNGMLGCDVEKNIKSCLSPSEVLRKRSWQSTLLETNLTLLGYTYAKNTYIWYWD